MYGQDTGGLGTALLANTVKAAFPINTSGKVLVHGIWMPRIAAPVALKPTVTTTPVLKLPNIAPPASTPAPGQPPVLILPDQPITRYDAAPAAGGPSGGTAIMPNVSDSGLEVTQASLFDSSKMPLLLAILAGAWFLSRRK